VQSGVQQLDQPGEQGQDEEENLPPFGTRTQRPEPTPERPIGSALQATPTGRNRRQIGGYARTFARSVVTRWSHAASSWLLRFRSTHLT